MSWRQVALAMVVIPILISVVLLLLILGAPMIICKLPSLCCERLRAFRYLRYVGPAYSGLVVPLLLMSLGFGWWQVLIGVAVSALAGEWMLPDPYTYSFDARKRRAVKHAIEYLEAGDGPSANYGMVSVVGTEVGRIIVSIGINDGSKPPNRRFFGVADVTMSVEELDFEYVSTNHDVQMTY